MRRRPIPPPPARTTVATAATVPGWVLRAGLALLLALGGLAAGAEGVQWAVVAALALVVAARPHAALGALAVAVLGSMLVLGEAPARWQLPALLAATHGVLALGAVAAVSSWRGRVELAVLRAELPAVLVVQALAQLAGVTAALLQGRATLPWTAVAALAGLGAVTWVLVAGLARRRLPPSQAEALEAERHRYDP